MYSNDIQQRFWAKVHRTPDSCWLWLGAKGRNAGRTRGTFAINRKTLQAPRVAWELENGAIPKGLCVCHRCDNPLCVRPDHLFLGTQRDNMYDMIDKGRKAKPKAKLQESDIPHILAAADVGKTKAEIGRAFGVAGSTIGQVLAGRTWRRITGISYG